MGVKSLHREEGAALVETALVVPVILLLLFAIFEMGLAFARYQVLSNASREVARVASLFDMQCQNAPGSVTADKSAEIARTIANYDDALGMANEITLASITGVCVDGGESTVVLRFDHELPVLGNFIDQASIRLEARTIMRNESVN